MLVMFVVDEVTYRGILIMPDVMTILLLRGCTDTHKHGGNRFYFFVINKEIIIKRFNLV
jgi:hypothetical protein